MMKTIVGLFDQSSQAHNAVSEISRLGISGDSVSYVGPQGSSLTSTASTDTDRGSKAGEGAGIGAATGAVAGGAAGILASLGLLAIPGIGPLLAAGPIVAALAGAGVGAATGGIIGGLIGLGIPEEDAEEYEEGVRRGGTLVTVSTPDHHVDEVTRIMERNGAVDVDKRSAEWRNAGWKSKYAGRSSTGTTATSMGGRGATTERTSDFDAGARQEQQRLEEARRQRANCGVRVYTPTQNP